MNDNFFLDRDGTPLTGKIPLQISLQGDCNALRSQANSELTTFLTDLRLSGLPQMRRTTQLIGGTMEMVHTYGVTQVTLVAVAKEDKWPEGFYGGFYFVPFDKGKATSLVSVTKSDKTSSLPGRPALPGTPDNPAVAADTTRAIVVQVHPTKDLKNAPLKNGAVRIFRAAAPLSSDGSVRATHSYVSEVPGTELLPLFMAATNTIHSTGAPSFQVTHSQILTYGGVPIYRSASITPTLPSVGFLVSHGVEKVPASDASLIRSGLLFSVSSAGVTYLDLSKNRGAVWTPLLTRSITSRELPIGTTKTITTVGGATSIRLHGTAAGGELSECTITIAKAETGYALSATITPRHTDIVSGDAPATYRTTTATHAVFPQAVQVDAFKQLQENRRVGLDSNANNAWFDADAVPGTILRHVAYQAYGRDYSTVTHWPAWSGYSDSGTNWLTNGVIPKITVSEPERSETYSLSANVFKGYHYRLRGMMPKPYTDYRTFSPDTQTRVDYDLPRSSRHSMWSSGYENNWYIDATSKWKADGYVGYVTEWGDPSHGALAHWHKPDPLFAEISSDAYNTYGYYQPARYVGSLSSAAGWSVPDDCFRMFDPFTTPVQFDGLQSNPAFAVTPAYTADLLEYLYGGMLYGTTYEYSMIADAIPAAPNSPNPTMLPGPVQPDYARVNYFLSPINNGFDPGSYNPDGSFNPGGYHANPVFDITEYGTPVVRLKDSPPAIANLYPGSSSNRGTTAALRNKTSPWPLAYPGTSDTCYYYLQFPAFPFVEQIGGNPTSIHGNHNAVGEQLYMADRMPIAAYPKRAAVFGFTESFVATGGRPEQIGSVSVTRAGDITANEHLAEWIPTNVSSFPVLAPITVEVTATPRQSSSLDSPLNYYMYALFNPRLVFKESYTQRTTWESIGDPQYDFGSRLPLAFMSVEPNCRSRATVSSTYTLSVLNADGSIRHEANKAEGSVTSETKVDALLPAVPTYLELQGEVAEQNGYVGPENMPFAATYNPVLKVGYWGTNPARNEFPAMLVDSQLVDSATVSTRLISSVPSTTDFVTYRGAVYDLRTDTYAFTAVPQAARAVSPPLVNYPSPTDSLHKGVFIGNKTSCVPLVDILKEWLALGADPDAISDVFTSDASAVLNVGHIGLV